MSMTRDAELLCQFVREQSQTAFSELVSRHIDAVYASARRQMRDPGLAEDITQAVFVMLAKKAKSLRPDVLLSAWLMTATWYACKNAQRRERRRKIHEARAATMICETVESPVCAAMDVEAVLDGALHSLKEADRAAVVMHFLQGRNFSEVAEALHTTAEAARKRTERAVASLRGKFARDGVRVAPAAIAPALLAAGGVNAPAGLAEKVGVTGASTSVVAIANAALVTTLGAKAKFAGLVLVGATTVVGVAFLLPVLLGSSNSHINQTRQIMTPAEAAAPRDALIKLAAAVRAGDGQEARKYADTSDPADQSFIDQAAESVPLAAQFKRSYRRMFGDVAADALPALVRPDNVPADAPVTIVGDHATVSLPTRNAPTVQQMNLGPTWDVPMVKIAGAWKVQVQSLQWWSQGIPLPPEFAAELARLDNDVCRRATEALEAGQFATPEEARKFVGDGVRASLATVVERWRASTQPSSQPASTGISTHR